MVSRSDQRSFVVNFRPRFTAMKSEIIAPPHIFLCRLVCSDYRQTKQNKTKREKLIHRDKEREKFKIIMQRFALLFGPIYIYVYISD